VDSRDGVAKTALDLGIAESMLYSWRAKSRPTGQSFEDQELQKAEISRHKLENSRLEDEVALLKKSGSALCKTAEVKYAMIKANEGISTLRAGS
jgi:hypothetical protein